MNNPQDIIPVTENAESYERRSLEMVRVIAKECSLDGDDEAKRFLQIMTQIRAGYGEEVAAENPVVAFQEKIIEGMANIVEFVLTYSNGHLARFGYLTQGKPGRTLSSSLSTLLANTFRLYLGNAGLPKNAELLADVFALSFPNMNLFSEHSSMAQGLLLGVVPTDCGVGFKLYFNTRLGGAGHRARLEKIFARVGVNGLPFYDSLYENATKVSFHGLGIDLFGAEPPRLKVYVRVPRASVGEEIARVLEGMDRERLDGALQTCEGFLGALEDPLSADEVELAVGIRSEGLPTLKLTTFFISKGDGDSVGRKIGSYLKSVGCSPKAFEKAAVEAARGVESTAVEDHPYHGVGIELPVGETPKVNVYMRPVI